DGSANALGSTTTTTYVDSTASPNTLYNYTVEAYDRATTPNVSAQSGPVSATTPAAQANDTTPPSVPTNVAAAAVTGSSTQIRVTWNASTDASGIAGYRVLRNGTV